jgi:diazepam-binding inhibitor (GABA receptor modulating acyl-CoA-binding protein)
MATAIQLEQEFESAQVRVKQLENTPSQDQLLSLYAYYKQGIEGDCNQSKPSMFNMRAFAKYQAWNDCRGISQTDAMDAYIKLVDSLVG